MTDAKKCGPSSIDKATAAAVGVTSARDVLVRRVSHSRPHQRLWDAAMSADSPTTVDELRRMAERIVGRGGSRYDELTIARALLAALPMVEAARAERLLGPDDSTVGPIARADAALGAFDKVVPR